MAVGFAEAGEFDTAKEMMKDENHYELVVGDRGDERRAVALARGGAGVVVDVAGVGGVLGATGQEEGGGEGGADHGVFSLRSPDHDTVTRKVRPGRG